MEKRVLGLMVVMLALSVCAYPAYAAEDWHLEIGMNNVGTNMIDEARVDWGGRTVDAGIVSPLEPKVEVGLNPPIPDTAEVQFAVADGIQTSRTVKVKSVIPADAYKDKNMTVMFNIDSCTYEVTVVFYHYVYVDDYSHDLPYDTDNENARVYEVWVSNETATVVYPVIISGHCKDEFPAVDPYSARVRGWAPFKLDQDVTMHWKEGATSEPVQQATLSLRGYWEKRRQIKKLYFIYQGSGAWKVTAYDYVSDAAKVVEPAKPREP